jgi:hypothetical protein
MFAAPALANGPTFDCNSELQKNIENSRTKFHVEILRRIDLIKNPAPESRQIWEKYYSDWQQMAPTYIKRTFAIYQRAKAQKNSYISWLEGVGFRFGPRVDDVYVPPLQDILITYLERMDRRVQEGFPPEDVILVERIIFKGQEWVYEGSGVQDGNSFKSVTFGAPIPSGYNGTTHLIPFGFHLEMLDHNIFGIGESIGLGTPAVTDYVSFLLHDLAHLSIFDTQPFVMPAFKAAGISLHAAKVDYQPNVRGWPDSRFTPQHIRSLRERGLLSEWVKDQELPAANFTNTADSKIADRVNELASEKRLALHALYISNVETLTNAHRAAIRYRLVLESSSLLSKTSARWLEQRLQSEGFLPVRVGDFYTSADIKRHLLALGSDAVLSAARLLVEEYPRLTTIYGGASRDIVQNEIRFRTSGPTGNSHFATMEYLWYRTSVALKANSYASLDSIAGFAAKLAAAAIASGEVNIVAWLTDIGTGPVKNSSLYNWICGTGAFIKDDYWVAYCRPSP